MITERITTDLLYCVLFHQITCIIFLTELACKLPHFDVVRAFTQLFLHSL